MEAIEQVTEKFKENILKLSEGKIFRNILSLFVFS